jgi:large subunit ribosomal protein L27
MLKNKNIFSNFFLSPSPLSFQKNFYFLNNINFATKMRAGVTKNNQDSAGRRLGVKKFGGQEILESQIILRQRGFKWKPGENVHYGKDHTLHASKEGIVKFSQDPWSQRRRVFVHVVEKEVPNRKVTSNF